MMENNFNFGAAFNLCSKNAAEAKEQCKNIINMPILSPAAEKIKSVMLNTSMNNYQTWSCTIPSVLNAASKPNEKQLTLAKIRSATSIKLSICKNCNIAISSHYSFCPYCGSELEGENND